MHTHLRSLEECGEEEREPEGRQLVPAADPSRRHATSQESYWEGHSHQCVGIDGSVSGTWCTWTWTWRGAALPAGLACDRCGGAQSDSHAARRARLVEGEIPVKDGGECGIGNVAARALGGIRGVGATDSQTLSLISGDAGERHGDVDIFAGNSGIGLDFSSQVALPEITRNQLDEAKAIIRPHELLHQSQPKCG